MKKFVKFMCLLLIVALIAILVLKNGATADNDEVEWEVTANYDTEMNASDEKTIRVNFSKEVSSYSVLITLSNDDYLSVTDEPQRIWDRGPTSGVTYTIRAKDNINVSEANTTFSISGEARDLDGTSHSVECSGTITIKGASQQVEILNKPSQIQMNVRDSGVSLESNIEASWSSSDENIASVSPASGTSVTVLPRGAGECTITASAGGKSDSVTVKVSSGGGDHPPVPENFTVSDSSVEVNSDSVATVTVTGGEIGNIQSSNPQVATAQASGSTVVITPTGVGSCTITISNADNSAQATVAVTVKGTDPGPGPGPEPIPDPEPADPQPVLTAGKTTLTPGGDTTTISTGGVQVIWSSSNKNAVVIDSSSTDTQATIISNKAGSAEITATALKGGKTASVIINVKENEQASPVIGPSSSIKLEVGKSTFVYADQSVTWTSSDPSIATVDSDGLVVAKSAGTVKITAKNKSGKTTSITFNITPATGGTGDGSGSGSGTGNGDEGGSGNGNEGGNVDEPAQSTSTFAISPSKTQRIKEGETLQIKVTKGTATSWKSSKPAVAKVDNNGKVTANSAGTTVITAVAADGSVAQVKVIVQTEDGQDPTNSESDEDVPSTGEASTQLILVVGAVTCVVAMFIFRKKTK